MQLHPVDLTGIPPGPYKVLQLSASPDDLRKFHYYSAVQRCFSALCTPYLLTAWCTTTLLCSVLSYRLSGGALQCTKTKIKKAP